MESPARITTPWESARLLLAGLDALLPATPPHGRGTTFSDRTERQHSQFVEMGLG